LLWISLSLSLLGSPADDEVRVLVLTGRNNHNWKETTPAIQRILEEAGGMKVDTAVPPEGLTEEKLKAYDVIVSDWNSWGGGSRKVEEAWTPEVRKAYLDFVRGGKGHVTIHAGGSSFYEGWPEYRKVALVFWDKGVTSHGRPHEFEVRIDKPDHAVAKGFDGFTTKDELWIRPGVVEGATVVASGASPKQGDGKEPGSWEPVAVSAHYGKGRCFATLLGHDAGIMQNEGFKKLLVRGVRWAVGEPKGRDDLPADGRKALPTL
jgi:type 1 glutamine amidotransferase